MQLSADNKTILRVKNEDVDSDGVFQIPKGVTSIGDSAFEYCISLRQLTIPDGVSSIGRWAFYGCNRLHTLTFPASVALIGEDVLVGCIDLARIIIDSEDKIELERITALLPEWFKSKALAKNLFDKVTCFCDKQLDRLTRLTQVNQLYRFFNYGNGIVSGARIENEERQLIEKDYYKLPEDPFWHINEKIGKGNPYYQRAKALIEHEPWPKEEIEFKFYKEKVKKIIEFCINSSTEEIQPSLEFIQMEGPTARHR